MLFAKLPSEFFLLNEGNMLGSTKHIVKMVMKGSVALMLTGLVAYFAAQPFLDLQEGQIGDAPVAEEIQNSIRATVAPPVPPVPEEKVEEILVPEVEPVAPPVEQVEPTPQPAPKPTPKKAPKPRRKAPPKPKVAPKPKPVPVVPPAKPAEVAPVAVVPQKDVEPQSEVKQPVEPPPAPLAVVPPPISEPVQPMDDDSFLEDVEPLEADWGDDELIVDVHLRRTLIYQGMFCLEKKGRPMIPLNELCSLLGLAITADETGARGWYIKEENTFSFDTATGEVVNKGEHSILPPEAYTFMDEELFIDMERYSELFPMDMKLDRNRLALIIIPREALPYELMKSRRAQETYSKAKQGLLYPISDLDYSALAPPQLNASISTGLTSKKTGDTYTTSASGLFRGDLLFMSTTLYGAGRFSKSKGKWDSSYGDLSFAGERKFVDNKYISKFMLGDIPSTTASYIAGGTLERGVRVTNTGAGGGETQWTRTFTGKALPGWDVELYQNKRRVGIQTMDGTGTYTFEDVPMNYGTNRMVLKLYGPQGQEEVREEVVNIGNTLKKGQVRYDFSVSQKGEGVFGKEISRVNTVSKEEQGTYRFNGKLKAGLLSTMSTEIGFGKDKSEGKDRYKGSLSLAGGYDGTLGKGTVAYSSKGSTFLDGSIGRTLENGMSFNAQGMYQISDNYDESSTKHSLRGSMSGREDVGENTDISYTFTAKRSQLYVEDSNKDDVQYALTGGGGLNSQYGYFGFNLTSNFYTQSNEHKESLLSGSASYTKMFDKGNFRAGISFNKSNTGAVGPRSSYASLNYRISKSFTDNLSVNVGHGDSDYWTVKNTLSYSGSRFSPYLSTSVNSSDTYSIFAGISIGLHFEPDTYTPAFGGGINGANCLVYNDKNYNNEFDEGDEPVKDVIVEGLRTGSRNITNENGRALLSGFAPSRAVDIQVNPTSIPDLNMNSQTGYAIYAREGKIYDLHFPLHVVSEIDGFAYRIKDDEADGRALVPVLLLDEKGETVDEVWTEGDGYFLFMDVLPGTYTVSISPEFLSKNEYSSKPSRDIEVTSESNSFSDNFLFYGEEKVVAILEEKFRDSALQNNDAFVFTDFSDMDEETEAIPTSLDLVNDALTAIPDETVESNAEVPESLDSSETVAKTAEPAVVPVPPVTPDYSMYGLIVDTFVSKKSAKRSVAFNEKRHAEELGEAKIMFRKRGDAYVVIVYNMKSTADMNRMSRTFMCAPQLIDITQADLPDVN